MKPRDLLLMVWLILIVVLFVNIHKARADDDVTVFFGGFSHHIGLVEGYERNETHNTIGIGYNDFELMFLKNSFNDDAFSLSYHYKYELAEWLTFGVRMGGVTGYDPDEMFTIGGITPYVQPTLTTSYKSFGVELGYLPQYSEAVKGGVATLLFNWRF